MLPKKKVCLHIYKKTGYPYKIERNELTECQTLKKRKLTEYQTLKKKTYPNHFKVEKTCRILDSFKELTE